MKKIRKIIGLVIVLLLFVAINSHAQEKMLCQGAYWTEDQANRIMKQWAGEWKTRADWEKRAERIRLGIIRGMKLDQMPKLDQRFCPIFRNIRAMDGYVMENIVILALALEAQATFLAPQYLEEMIRILPEKLYAKGYLGSIQY